MTEIIWDFKDTGGDYNGAGQLAQWITDTSVDLTAAATRLLAGTLTGAIPTGSAVTQDVSNATGTTIGVTTSGQMLLTVLTGTFSSGQEVRLDSDPTNQHFLTSDAGTTTVVPVLECYSAAAPYSITADISFSGAITDTSNYRIIRAAAGEAHNGIDPTTGFYITNGAGFNDIFDLAESNSIVEYIGFESTYTGANFRIIFDTNQVSAGYYLGCLARNTGGAANFDGFGGTAGGKFYACLAIDCADGFKDGVAGGITTWNCVAKDCTTGFDTTGNSDYDIRNCLAYGNTTNWSMGSGSAGSSTTNASELGTPPGTSPITSVSTTDGVDIVAPSTDNMQAADNGALDEDGTDPGASYPNGSVSGTQDDIVGVTWGASWDVGAFVAATATATPKGPLGHPLKGPFGGPV